jgi:hypothetical protein
MSLLYRIRKWLQESPHSVPEEGLPEEAPEPKRIPALELHVYRSYTSNSSAVTTIYYTNPSWQDMDSQAAMASARILQSEILATYRAFLSGDVEAVPYIHLGDTLIRCDDITTIRAVVGWGKS